MAKAKKFLEVTRGHDLIEKAPTPKLSPISSYRITLDQRPDEQMQLPVQSFKRAIFQDVPGRHPENPALIRQVTLLKQ